MEVPAQKCPNTEKKGCNLCGPWMGWTDLENPRRSPTHDEWDKCCKEMQARHNAIRQREFDTLEVKEQEK